MPVVDFSKNLLNSNHPVVVWFTANFFNPVIASTEVVERFAEEFDGYIIVAKVDVDEEPDLVAEYGIAHIPSFVLFEYGSETARHVGAITMSKLRALAAV